MAERVCLIVNPSKAEGLGLDEEARALGVEVIVPEDVGEAVAAAVRRDFARIVVGGGDGTVHAAVGRLLDGAASSEVELGIVPLGTANDFAAALGLPNDPIAALRFAVEATARTTDAGQSACGTFANAVSLGFGADATRGTPSELKGLLGPLAYVVQGIGSFMDARPERARITTPEGQFEAALLVGSVCNGRRVGGFDMAPEARVDDGLLDLVAVVDVSPEQPRTILELAQELSSGEEGAHVRRARAPWFEIEPLEAASQTVNLDGEGYRQRGPNRIEVRPGALRVVRPSS